MKRMLKKCNNFQIVIRQFLSGTSPSNTYSINVYCTYVCMPMGKNDLKCFML